MNKGQGGRRATEQLNQQAEVYGGEWDPTRLGQVCGKGSRARDKQAPMSLPALQPPCPSADSSARILKDASGVEPGWVEIMPRKRVTDHVRTWLLSAQTK